MKIAFLLPTLLYGRDGIADYTARLAGEVEKSGHQTQLVPLGRNNWLSTGTTLRENVREAERRIREFAPDVISWQFDGRIFHPQSIFPKSLVPRFSSLTSKVHLMAHETWEGDEQGARLRRRIKGVAQKHSFQGALQVINPDIAHTTNELYLRHLSRSRIPAGILPLFSNIPLNPLIKPRDDYDGDTWEFVLFGGFRDHWDPSNFISGLKDFCKRIVIHHFGRHSSPSVIHSLRDACRGWATFIEHGLQTDEEVSQILMNSHFAISTYNLLLLNKSSVYATFVEHGLPVIVPRLDGAGTSGGETPEIPTGTILIQKPSGILYKQKRLPTKDTLKSTTERFLWDLDCFPKTGVFDICTKTI